MNDEELVEESTNEAEISTGNSLPTDPSGTGIGDLPERPAEGEGEGVEAPAISADSLPDPDPALAEPAQSPQEDGLEQLRGELNRLRWELATRDEMLTRIGEECEEFQRLYPEKTLSELPDGVWEDVRRGVPIAAAFALSERRRHLAEQRALASNLANGKRSSGSVGGIQNDYFSPAEVRAMSQTEVRENYQKIMRSMQKWH